MRSGMQIALHHGYISVNFPYFFGASDIQSTPE